MVRLRKGDRAQLAKQSRSGGFSSVAAYLRSLAGLPEPQDAKEKSA